MKVYLAGKMRGISEWNFPAFEEAEQNLLAQGIDVISPHKMDINNGFNPLDETTLPSVEECAQRDTEAILDVDALVFLPGWETSKGARAERALAEWLCRPCFLYPSLDLIPDTE